MISLMHTKEKNTMVKLQVKKVPIIQPSEEHSRWYTYEYLSPP